MTLTVTGLDIAVLAGAFVLCCAAIALNFWLMDKFTEKDRTRDVEYWNGNKRGGRK